MAESKLDAWLDALQARQEKLEQELEALNAETGRQQQALGGQAAMPAAQRSTELEAPLRKMEQEADAAGRARAEAAKRDLDALRGEKAASGSRRGRPGVVRL